MSNPLCNWKSMEWKGASQSTDTEHYRGLEANISATHISRTQIKIKKLSDG